MVKPKETDFYWDTIITPKRNWWDLNLKETWKYRDLIGLFVRRNFVAAYKQTILGPAWHFITPLFSSGIFTLVFSGIAGLPTDDIPPFLFYLAGNVIWFFFSSCLTGTSGTFIGNQGVFGKVYFPRLTVPFSVALSNLLHFAIRLILLLISIFIFQQLNYNIGTSWWILLSPILVIMVGLMGIGWGIIISSLTTKYRDLQVLVSYGVSLLLYATPVLYPASMVPEKFQVIYFLNPIAPIVEAFRFAFLGAGTVDISKLLYSFIFMVISFLIGLMMFNRVEQNFMDTI